MAIVAEVDDDLAVHVPARLKLDRRADLLHRESCRDGHTELARRDQAGNLLGHDARASRLLNILMDGLRPAP